MFLVPFSMGPIGGPLSKNGIELTDSPYVAISMHVMARVGNDVLDCIRKDGNFIRYDITWLIYSKLRGRSFRSKILRPTRYLVSNYFSKLLKCININISEDVFLVRLGPRSYPARYEDNLFETSFLTSSYLIKI